MFDCPGAVLGHLSTGQVMPVRDAEWIEANPSSWFDGSGLTGYGAMLHGVMHHDDGNPVRLGSIREPEKKILLADATSERFAQLGSYSRTGAPLPEVVGTNPGIATLDRRDGNWGHFAWLRHDGKSNVLFADGSARSLPATDPAEYDWGETLSREPDLTAWQRNVWRSVWGQDANSWTDRDYTPRGRLDF